MPFDVNWVVDKYREDHESDQHWSWRKAFMERWKYFYPEDRLVCLARVFTNIGFLGCKYPLEVMQEVSGLSKEVTQNYQRQLQNVRKTFESDEVVNMSVNTAERSLMDSTQELHSLQDEIPHLTSPNWICTGQTAAPPGALRQVSEKESQDQQEAAPKAPYIMPTLDVSTQNMAIPATTFMDVDWTLPIRKGNAKPDLNIVSPPMPEQLKANSRAKRNRARAEARKARRMTAKNNHPTPQEVERNCVAGDKGMSTGQPPVILSEVAEKLKKGLAGNVLAKAFARGLKLVLGKGPTYPTARRELA
ncbi:uncharacterized protein LOC126968344 [Leptidea sinapis]|uniref:uncharacterized protein LOC126968344 n=1 Tax=Leptidea sinapis TaxID=189913 RepID=UPI002130E7F0|nr:uncharacterized protein LOC126968344 [Leptidea sinapis]